MNTCPLTIRPGQIFGWRKARCYEAPGLYPIFGIGGGSEPPSDPPPADPPADPPPADPPADPPKGGGKWDGKIESLDPEVQKLVEKYKTEAATASSKSRDTARKEAEQAILKKLGLVEGDEKPDPDKLAADLAEARTSQRQAAVELAVFKTASKHLGDSNALIDSRSFLAKVKDLDPSASDFEDNVVKAAKAAVTDNPKLKATQAAASSSIDGPPGGERRGDKPKNLSDAIAGHYGTG